ncbi:MAG: 2-C-methyl-D-erythritol 2,4-cyclodiphosphate synthase [Planctomycetales bacterium]|nr:2-C-methyl-D-erythritol 2,4-cyclodiphosphate synthase [Planctomycetales bacterium]
MSFEIRVGLGHDTHRIEAGGPLRLGGLDVAVDFHLAGHSDADVLLHAVTDSLLGAANLGDIGELFPDDDPANRGKDSAVMLLAAQQRVTQAGWKIMNIDCVVLAERPRLLPLKGAMCQRLAEILQLEPQRIAIKGKTGEKTGDVGSGKIMQAICTCLLFQP